MTAAIAIRDETQDPLKPTVDEYLSSIIQQADSLRNTLTPSVLADVKHHEELWKAVKAADALLADADSIVQG